MLDLIQLVHLVRPSTLNSQLLQSPPATLQDLAALVPHAH